MTHLARRPFTAVLAERVPHSRFNQETEILTHWGLDAATIELLSTSTPSLRHYDCSAAVFGELKCQASHTVYIYDGFPGSLVQPVLTTAVLEI